MKSFMRGLLCWGLLVLSGWVLAAQSVTGDLSGTFTGSATDGSGSYSGNIEGRWTAAGTFDTNGVFIENVTGDGTFGGAGLAGAWTVGSYNAQTKTINVNWSGPGARGPLSASGSADGSVALVINLTTGTATGQFQGQVYTPQGVKTVAGTWTVKFQGLANTTVTGRVQGTFSGSASYIGAVSGTATGDWTVKVLSDGSFTGTAKGSYSGGNVSVPGYGVVCICGTWTANIVDVNGQYQLQGSWTHPVVSGSLDGGGGGPIVWYLNLNSSPLQASGNFNGQVNFVVTVPVVGSITVPITVGGDWNATLPLNP